MAELGVFYSRMPPDEVEKTLLRDGKPIGYFTLSGGENVFVAARLAPFLPPTLPDGKPLLGSSHHINPAALSAPNRMALEELARTANPAAVLFNKPADGSVLVLTEIGGIALQLSPST
jgi:hypothetical protein